MTKQRRSKFTAQIETLLAIEYGGTFHGTTHEFISALIEAYQVKDTPDARGLRLSALTGMVETGLVEWDRPINGSYIRLP